MGSLTSALDRIPSSQTIRHLQLGPSCIKKVYVAFAANSDLCFSFLRRCADYGEKMLAWYLPSIAPPTPFRVGAPHGLRERIMRLQSESRGISAENAVVVAQGLFSYQSTPFDSTSPLTRACIRLGKVSKCISHGPFSRTGGDIWVERFAREAVILGHGGRWWPWPF
jgi:hypothetical protein